MANRHITRDVLTIREAAGVLRCSKTHVSKLVRGLVPGVPALPHVRAGRRLLISKVWIEEWLEAAKITGRQGADADDGKRC